MPVAAAGVIGGEARRLERLVQDLLDLARLDADRFSLELGPVDCLDVARRVADGFRPRADDAGIALAVAPMAGTPLWVQADPDRLGQVLANLVENAFSFASGRVVVGAGTVGRVPAAWVVDDGPGIAGDELGRGSSSGTSPPTGPPGAGAGRAWDWPSSRSWPRPWAAR